MLSLSKTLVSVLAPLVTLILIPIFFISWLFNEIVRFTVSHLLDRKYHGKVTLVPDGFDGMWSYKKPGSSRNILIAIVTQSGSVTKQKAESLVSKSALNYKNFKGKRPYDKLKKILMTEYGYVCWKEDENFNIKNHIRVLDKDFLYCDADIMNLLSEYSEDMEDSKPQWEIVIVPRYNDGSDKEKSTIIIRFNHAYMDGLSFIMLCKEHLTEKFDYVLDPQKFQIPFWKKSFFYINSFLYGPYVMGKMIANKHKYKPWILINSNKAVDPVPKKNFACSDYIGFDVIQKIRMSADAATVPNVIATALVTTMKKVIPARRMLPEVTVGEVIALLPYLNSDPQNRFTQHSYQIQTDDEDPLEKLRRSKRASSTSIIGPIPLTLFYAFKFFGRFPIAFSPLLTDGTYDSFFLSNIPFSKTNVSFKGGCQVLSVAGWPPQPNDTGISVSTISSNNQIKISISADSRWLTNEELHQIMNLIPKEIENMAARCTCNLQQINSNSTSLKNASTSKTVKFQ